MVHCLIFPAAEPLLAFSRLFSFKVAWPILLCLSRLLDEFLLTNVHDPDLSLVNKDTKLHSINGVLISRN